MRTRVSFLFARIASAAVLLSALTLSLALAAGPPPPPPPPPPPHDTLGYIQRITFGTPACDTCPPRACPNEPLVVTVSGFVPEGCVTFRGLRELPVGAAFTVLAADFVVDTCAHPCFTTALRPFSGSVVLPPPLPGLHSLMLMVNVRSCPDTNATARSTSRMISYEVLPDCHPQVPVDSLVRTFTSLRILPEHPCNGDSLTLQLVKNGCPPCVHLTGLFQTRVRGLVASLDWRPQCMEFACLPETLSFGLGRLAAGSFRLLVNTDVHVLDTPNPDSTISYPGVLSFEVARTCDSTIAGCVFPFLMTGAGFPECALRVPPGGGGELTLFAQSPVPLGGIQGRIDCTPPFRITGLRVPDGVPGLHVSWSADRGGARYLLFSDPAAPIPAGPVPVLAVALLAAPDALPGTHGALIAPVELASDPDGDLVPVCDTRAVRIAPIGLCVLADSASCDANGDGRLDIRDLVRMVRCLRTDSGDSTGHSVCFDCDGDGSFGIPDVFCCAREILRGPGTPRDSARIDGTLQVTLDTPEPVGDELRLRVRVRGARALDAALLRLRFPADRWRVSAPLEANAAPSAEWLPLVDGTEAGRLVLGALRLAPSDIDELVYVLRAERIAGAGTGGTLVVEGADLTAADGSALRPATALPSAELAAATPPSTPASVVELSAASPNPFARSTTFSVSLPRDADVDLAVHDLAGRRVATLVQGRLGAGRRTFTWNGAGARDGLYFVRLSVDGRVFSNRVALLRDGR